MSDARVALVNEHMRLENAHDFDGCIATFGRARYEVVANGEVYDGETGVDRFLAEDRRAFPDFRFEPTRVRGLPGTGRTVDFAMCLIFDFDGEAMVNERIYFDLGTALRQLGVAVDPTSARGKRQAFLVNPVTHGHGRRAEQEPAARLARLRPGESGHERRRGCRVPLEVRVRPATPRPVLPS